MEFVEIRSYSLKPHTRHIFHQRMSEEALPMLKRWRVDVVSFGPSPHDDDSYYLIRAYDSLSARAKSQDAFYGSAEWKEGPRNGIVELIDSYVSIVLQLDEPTVNALRK